MRLNIKCEILPNQRYWCTLMTKGNLWSKRKLDDKNVVTDCTVMESWAEYGIKRFAMVTCGCTLLKRLIPRSEFCTPPPRKKQKNWLLCFSPPFPQNIELVFHNNSSDEISLFTPLNRSTTTSSKTTTTKTKTLHSCYHSYHDMMNYMDHAIPDVLTVIQHHHSTSWDVWKEMVLIPKSQIFSPLSNFWSLHHCNDVLGPNSFT